MGCWAFGVYQSDDSMDWEGEIYDRAGLDRYEDDFDETAPAVRAALESKLPEIMAELATPADSDDSRAGYYKAVGYQMLACVLMRHGCAISDAILETICQGIVACPEYQSGKVLLAQSGGVQLSKEVLKANGVDVGMHGYAGTINRLTGRIGALERLCKEFREYDNAGGTLYHYQDQGSLELYGQPEANSSVPA